MIKGGSGGGSTRTGLKFEKETSLEQALIDAGFEVIDGKVFQASNYVGELAAKHQLYAFLSAREVPWEGRLSKRLLPDEAFYSFRGNQMSIIEKKWQETEGSVDEKLQTVGFKIRQYKKLLDGTGIGVKFIYLLNDWFAKPKYADVLEFIEESGGTYHFLSVPLDELDL